MIRRALACCCTLAVLLAGAALAAAPSITHRCETDFFQYVDSHPIGSSWAYDIPPAYIPGGTSPSNAVTRLTADTRLAFVGAFDAYFRRLMASVCFGTAECTNIVASLAETPLRLRSAADWIDDYTITNVFGYADGWCAATNRNYAVTNITVTATNWIGYATNIVYNPAGKPVGVKIENRYEVVTTNILDTTRILLRYLRDHNFMRRSAANPNPVANMLVSTGYDDDMRPVPDPWPNRNDLRVGRYDSTFEPYFGWIYPEDFLGWSFSAVAEPSFTHSSGAGWETSLYDLFAHLCAGSNFFYTTTWDLFGAENSRYAVLRDLTRFGWYSFLDYDSICPDDWEDFVNFDLGPAQVEGYAAMTNLVGVYLTPSKTPTFSPGFPLTNSTRIGWAEWAGSDAYLALADTAIAGNAAMPHLHYEVAATSGTCRITYRGSGADNWICFHTWIAEEPGGYYRRIFEITNSTFTVHRDKVELLPNPSETHPTDRRIELIRYGYPRPPEFSAEGLGYPEDIYGNPMIGYNYVGHPINDAESGVLGWAYSYYVGTESNPQNGDILTIDSFDGDIVTAPYFIIDGPHGPAYKTRVYNGEYYLHFRATNVTFEAVPPIEAATTKTARPFDYTLVDTNFVSRPCIYPHPSFVGEEPNGLAGVDRIYPTAISAVGVATNFEFTVSDGADRGDGIVPDKDGFYFAATTPDSLIATAKKVDDFWLDADSKLGTKMAFEILHRTEADPRNLDDACESVANRYDALTADNPYYFIDLFAMAFIQSYSGPSWYPRYYPNSFRVKNVSGGTFELEAVVLTNGHYEAISPQPTHCIHYWTCRISQALGDWNEDHIIQAAAAAVGRLSGLEAVKWKFPAMHQPTTNPTP